MSSVKAPLQKKSEKPHSSFPATELDKATIRFAGDSGDGMQLTGSRFSSTSVLAGNDVISFPDYPAEIRGPIQFCTLDSGMPFTILNSCK